MSARAGTAPPGVATGGVRIDAEVAARGARLGLSLPAASVTALVGPNGAGKSTVVQLIGGWLRPDAGSVVVGGQVVASPAAWTPPHRRPVAVLDQRPLLFPHLDVLDNVAFGVRARGASRRAARARAEAELDAVGALGFAGRRPNALSGGEAQRVALARALATDPAVICLDEPFSALDVGSAAAMRGVLAARLPATGAAVALVTHDPLDVWALADKVVQLEGGRVVASGSVAEVLGRPVTAFLAELSGVSLVVGTAEGDVLATAGGVRVAGQWDATRSAHPGQAALATFSPAAVALFADAPQGSPRNSWPVTVTRIAPRGATVRVDLELPDGQGLAADVTAAGAAALGVRPGLALHAQVKATQVTLYAR